MSASTIMRCETPLGACLLLGDERALRGLWFEGAAHYARTLPPDAREGSTPALRDAAQWLGDYFAGLHPSPLALTLTPDASAFQSEVLDLLLEIPEGRTTTYSALAAALAQRRGLARMSAQAVGGAVARNPISIVIPCHRVLGADGSLTGYAGGLARKRWLLEHEGAALQTRAGWV